MSTAVSHSPSPSSLSKKSGEHLHKALDNGTCTNVAGSGVSL